MIYAKSNISQMLVIPRSVSGEGAPYTLKMRSTIDLEIVSVATDVVAENYLYYTIEVELPKMQVGEWEYALIDSVGKSVASGVCVIVADARVEIENETEIEYTQYGA